MCLLAPFFLGVACAGGSTPTAPSATGPVVAAATLQRLSIGGSASVDVGQQITLTTQAVWSDGATRSAPITWTSSIPTVASVNSSGVVVGVRAGTTTITATSAGVSSTAGVTVFPDYAGAWRLTIRATTCGPSVGGVIACVGTNGINQEGFTTLALTLARTDPSQYRGSYRNVSVNGFLWEGSVTAKAAGDGWLEVSGRIVSSRVSSNNTPFNLIGEVSQWLSRLSSSGTMTGNYSKFVTADNSTGQSQLVYEIVTGVKE